MNPSEKKIEKEVCDYARKLGWTPRKQQGAGDRGKADRYFLSSKGRIVFIEFKRSGLSPTPLQEKDLELLQSLGFIAVVVDNIEDGEWLFDQLRSGAITAGEFLTSRPYVVSQWKERENA